MKPITADSKGVKIKLDCLEEDMPYIGEFDDKETEGWIETELRQGNAWAWCIAKVTVSYKGTLFATDYLCGCSYRSERDFMEGGYYEDMVNECIDEINAQLKNLTED